MLSLWDFYGIRWLFAKLIRFLTDLALWRERVVNPQPKPNPPDRTTECISEGRKIRLDIYLPPKAKGRSGLLPIHVNWHASGFLLESMGEDAGFCAFIAARVGCVVIDSDYSKSPRHPWPAPIHDVEAVLRWVKSNAASNGWDIERLSVGGFSAGGNLALIASTVGPERDGIRAVVAFYPPYVSLITLMKYILLNHDFIVLILR